MGRWSISAINEIKFNSFTAPTPNRDPGKSSPDLRANSPEPEQPPTQPQSNWFRSSVPPSSWRPRLDSACQKAGPRLERRAPVAAAALGTPGPYDTRLARPKLHEKPAGWSADRPAVLPVAAPR